MADQRRRRVRARPRFAETGVKKMNAESRGVVQGDNVSAITSANVPSGHDVTIGNSMFAQLLLLVLETPASSTLR